MSENKVANVRPSSTAVFVLFCTVRKRKSNTTDEHGCKLVGMIGGYDWKVKGTAYGSRRCQDEDNIADFTAVYTPVLRPLQTGNANTASLKTLHVTAE